MIFTETKLPGAFVIELERTPTSAASSPAPGAPASSPTTGSAPRLAQCNISFNAHRGTLRGMHYQAAPHEEAKLVALHGRARSTTSIVDLRPGLADYLQHVGVELTAERGTMLYVPEGFAHGFLTLEDGTEVFYQMSELYAPDGGQGRPLGRPAFGIAWPAPVDGDRRAGPRPTPTSPPAEPPT